MFFFVLFRQASCGIAPTLPLHDLEMELDISSDVDGIIDENLTTTTAATAAPPVINLRKNQLNRLASDESYHSTSIYLSFNNENTIYNDDHPQRSNHPIPLQRLVSSISNYSTITTATTPGIEESSLQQPLYCDSHRYLSADSTTIIDDHATVVLQNGCDYYHNNSDIERDDDDDDDVFVEDETSCITEELRQEITSFKTNQLCDDNCTNMVCNRLNDDPRKNQISNDIFLAYLKVHSYSCVTVVFILVIMNQTLRVIADFWLANWANNDEHHHDHHHQSNNNGVGHYIKSYVILSIVSVIISLATNLYAQLITIKAVRQLHDNLLDTMVRCPLRFFDRTPIGRIINRFTTDLNVIDKVRL